MPPPEAAASVALVPSVPAPARALPRVRRALGLFGPAWIVAVGYVDPGNWATDIAAGSTFGYALLWVLVGAGVAAMLLQGLAARVGVATGRDLAQITAEVCNGPARALLWVLAEVAIAACDLAELIGAAIALKLLFGLPVLLGVSLTALDAFALLLFSRGPAVQRIATVLLCAVAGAVVVQACLAHPDWTGVVAGLKPNMSAVRQPGGLVLAAGIIGATVMPHNLYLHSALAKTRGRGAKPGPWLRYLNRDTVLALSLATVVNAAILVLAGAAFHPTGTIVTDLQEAYRLLAPLLGSTAALLFAGALLAAGQSSTLTASLAGQVVMEGFMRITVPPIVRRLLTRGLALIPALFAAAAWGDSGLGKLLIGSQVLLSLQLPFVMIPMLRAAGNRRRMGELAAPAWTLIGGWIAAGLVLTTNVALVFETLHLAKP